MAQIERVVYRTGFVERLGEAPRLPAITMEAADLSEDVLALRDRHLSDLGGGGGGDECAQVAERADGFALLWRSEQTCHPLRLG